MNHIALGSAGISQRVPLIWTKPPIFCTCEREAMNTNSINTDELKRTASASQHHPLQKHPEVASAAKRVGWMDIRRTCLVFIIRIKSSLFPLQDKSMYPHRIQIARSLTFVPINGRQHDEPKGAWYCSSKPFHSTALTRNHHLDSDDFPPCQKPPDDPPRAPSTTSFSPCSRAYLNLFKCVFLLPRSSTLYSHLPAPCLPRRTLPLRTQPPYHYHPHPRRRAFLQPQSTPSG